MNNRYCAISIFKQVLGTPGAFGVFNEHSGLFKGIRTLPIQAEQTNLLTASEKLKTEVAAFKQGA